MRPPKGRPKRANVFLFLFLAWLCLAAGIGNRVLAEAASPEDPTVTAPETSTVESSPAAPSAPAEPAEPAPEKPADEPRAPAPTPGEPPAVNKEAPAGLSADQPEIVIGGIFDLTGQTSSLGQDYARGGLDAAEFINRSGGIGGAKLRLAYMDYASDAGLAVEAYNKLRAQYKVPVILGWGAADTRALKKAITNDQVVYMSADLDADLTDPQQAPYNFSIGVNYSDQARLAMRYAKDNGGKRVSFIYPEHPYGQAPIPAGKAFAEELGLEVGPDLNVDLRATEAHNQMLQLRDFDPDFSWVGGTVPSTAVLLAEAEALKIRTKFLVNNWGIGERLAGLSEPVAQGRAYGFLTVRPYGFDCAATSDILSIAGDQQHTIQYHKGWASILVLAEALNRARAAGGNLRGPGIKAALETLKDYETGGLTPPLTFTPIDHRATTTAGLYALKDGGLVLIADVSIERKRGNLGW